MRNFYVCLYSSICSHTSHFVSQRLYCVQQQHSTQGAMRFIITESSESWTKLENACTRSRLKSFIIQGSRLSKFTSIFNSRNDRVQVRNVVYLPLKSLALYYCL
ncbi:hypothetical protein QL285_026746 [Trifolium repens]|nr:hypothetical protein QL285_026746 [Trifolium repens]